MTYLVGPAKFTFNLGAPGEVSKNRSFDNSTCEPVAYVSCPRAFLRAV